MASSFPPSLPDHLSSLLPSDTRIALRDSVLPALFDTIADISNALQQAQHVALVGTANVFGDDQLNVDVACEDIIRAALQARCPSVVTASSEEDPVEKPVREASFSDGTVAPAEQYTVAFDPLDGSSIVGANWTVGTIFGVWDGRTAIGHHLPPPAERLVAAVLGVYGPRVTAVVALRVPGGGAPACFEVGIDAGGPPLRRYEIVRPAIRLAPPPFKTRYFAPANLRSAAHDQRYMTLITHYITEAYTLRYCGGLVPDVIHVLVKGHGVYVSPVTGTSRAKLRRLYELCPVALVVECAGGQAVDPTSGKRILDTPLLGTDERAGLVFGTSEEVDLAMQMLLG